MKYYVPMKKILDILFASILLILSLPVLIAAIIALKIESTGPVLYKQERPGKGCKVFTLYKFRTMLLETERGGEPLTDMERITKIGAFLRRSSVDELPQLFNIIRGEMSFIGPRPLLVQYLKNYSAEQMRRHEVTPGISGWAQVNGRNAIGWDQKFQMDVWYVDHISLILDAKILFLTLLRIIDKKGVNNSEMSTMPMFYENFKK